MSVSLSIDEFVRDPARHIERVARQGERIVLARGEVALAEITPPSEARSRTLRAGALPEAMAALPRLSEAEAFARDLEGLRSSPASAETLRDPWAS